MRSPQEFEALMHDRWRFLQSIEESLRGRTPKIVADVSDVGSGIVTPKSMQHVGEQITEIVKSDWTNVKTLSTTVLPHLKELIEFWETIFDRHRQATEIFSAAPERPYCLLLRSFTGVTNPIEVPGARVVMYVNTPELDANIASTLMAEAKWLNPVTCLHTDDMQLLTKNETPIPSFRVLTVSWERILKDAIATSGSIIMYVHEDSPGVRLELECIQHRKLESRTVVVHRGDTPPASFGRGKFADVMSVGEFLKASKDQLGPAPLSPRARKVLRTLSSTAITRTKPSHRLRSIRCEIVDSGMHGGIHEAEAASLYFVTQGNAATFVNYVELVPDSFLRWNTISQDMACEAFSPVVTTSTRSTSPCEWRSLAPYALVSPRRSHSSSAYFAKSHRWQRPTASRTESGSIALWRF